MFFMENQISGERPELNIIDNNFKLRADKATYARYLFATQFLDSNKSVLEIGAGMGHGALFLSYWAKHVTGIDYDKSAIKVALSLKDRYQITNMDFRDLPVEQMDELVNRYDVVTCFEVIEHLEKDTGLELISNIKQVLTPEGVCVISTPFIDLRGKTYWKFHPHEYFAPELKRLLTQRFRHVKAYYQGGDGLAIVSSLFFGLFNNFYTSDATVIFVCSDEPINTTVAVKENILYLIARGAYRNLKYLITSN
jgi:2-polyprenyl-3-methyl-5-hydroxy-6-metoxy-1,4-benzoquinol methylase